jgi:predicted amidophosphoribosyltransferase
VLYFLLRQPIASACPVCQTPVHSEYHFCPQCSFQVANSCGVCFRSARVTDQFCVYCGHELAKDGTPSRLRAFQN